MVPQKRDSMRLVPVVGKPGDLQLAVDGPDDEVRLLAALEEAKVLAEELRRGAVITGEEMYTRLGMPEFRSPEGDAHMTVVTFSLLLPLLYPGYDLSESAGKDAVGERVEPARTHAGAVQGPEHESCTDRPTAAARACRAR